MNKGAEPSIVRAIITGRFDKKLLSNALNSVFRILKFNFLVKEDYLKRFPTARF